MSSLTPSLDFSTGNTSSSGVSTSPFSSPLQRSPLFNTPANNPLTSWLFSPVYAASGSATQPTQDVKGAQIGPPGPPPGYQPTGGGSGGSGGSNPPSNSGPSDSQLINDAYNSQISALNDQANNLQGQQNSILGDINSSADTSKNSLTSNYNLSNSNIDQQAQAGGQRQQDALTAAKRLYQELIQGGQQRFGGASSAGEAYQALTGQQLQRNQQQIGTDYNTFMGQIAQAHQAVDTQYSNATAQLESQRQAALDQANRDFQDKMSQISSLKDQAAGDKANAQLSALQNLRNQIYNINLAVAQNNGTLQNLYAQQKAQLQQAQDALTQQTQGANTNLQAFAGNATTNPTNQLAFNTTPSTQTVSPTGQTNNQLLGMIAGQPINPNDLFNQNYLTA